MREETDGMDTEISDKNTNIEAVQFVIHTEFITILETVDEIVPEEEKSSFLDKLIDLFR